MRRPALPSALVLSLVLVSAAGAPARAAEPLWRDSPGAAAGIAQPIDVIAMSVNARNAKRAERIIIDSSLK